jgi:hypothetical protein
MERVTGEMVKALLANRHDAITSSFEAVDAILIRLMSSSSNLEPLSCQVRSDCLSSILPLLFVTSFGEECMGRIEGHVIRMTHSSDL